MTIVMGLDQHRAQITAEWIDTETGEIGRTRVRPADRAGVRRFLGRFGGQRLEPPLVQPVDPALLATDQRYERTLATADEGDEWREVEALADLDPVGHGNGQR